MLAKINGWLQKFLKNPTVVEIRRFFRLMDALEKPVAGFFKLLGFVVILTTCFLAVINGVNPIDVVLIYQHYLA